MNLARVAAEINMATFEAEKATAWPDEIIDWLCGDHAQTLLWATEDAPDIELLAEGWLKMARAEDRLQYGPMADFIVIIAGSDLGLSQDKINWLLLPF